MEENKTVVNILGKEFKIVSQEDGEYVARLAYSLNERLAKVNADYVGLSTNTLLSLVALNLSDELYKSKDTLSQAQNELQDIRDALRQTQIELNMTSEKVEAGIESELKRLRETNKDLESENKELRRRKGFAR